MKKTSADVSNNLKDHALSRLENPATMWGVAPWGLPGLDAMTGGIQREDLTILMARPAMGKSAFLTKILASVASYFRDQGNGMVARVVSCEMSAEQLQQRMVCLEARVSARRVQEGALTLEEFARYEDACNTIAALPIEYEDEPTSLKASVEWLTKDKKCGWFGVDYLQIHPLGRDEKTDSNYLNASNISTAFRLVARNHCPGLLLSQMSRKCEERQDKRPQLADLRDSGQIEQDGALILGLYRDDVYTKTGDDEPSRAKPAELLVRKHRKGPVGTVELLWQPANMDFVDVSALAGV